MKKNIITLFLISTIFFLLTSCGNKNESISTIPPTSIVTTTEPIVTDPIVTTPVITTPVVTTPVVTTPVVENPIPTVDPYENVESTDFYMNYTEATSYEDANYRTSHYFMSGSIDDDDRYYLPTTYTLDTVYKVSDSTLSYRDDNTYESYTINYLNGESKTIYYGGGYVSLDEVVAYIYAFGEVPPNSNYGTSNRTQSVKNWGKFGRCNVGRYSNDVSKYKYEPELPTKSSSGTVYTYTETDFGSTGNFLVNNSNQSEYNNGNYITRGTCRIVFTNNAKDISERHVFYTYNHYNDFQEYLNFGGGFGRRFGNESNGGVYNKGSNPSPYIRTSNIALTELRRLLGYA